jgi:hypothetical protein
MTTGKLSTASPISISNEDESGAETGGDRDREYSETNPLLRRDVRAETGPLEGAEAEERMNKLVKRMKIQIWAGMGSGMLIASGIGAAFIAVVRLLFASRRPLTPSSTLKWVIYGPKRNKFGKVYSRQ